jgi:zinc transport system substrate-binding protein
LFGVTPGSGHEVLRKEVLHMHAVEATRLAAVVVLVAALARPASPATPLDRVRVIASFYPLYEFARQVGGDRVTVRNLVPPGAHAHDYEPTPRDVIALREAQVVIYNGAGFEPWVRRLLPRVPARVVKVEATAGLPLRRQASGPHRGEPDPHVWLDPALAARQVEAILAGLVRADPPGRAIYEANAAAYQRQLASLHARVERTLGTCRKKVFVASHAAFAYFAARYGLTQVSISGLSPEAEPSPARIREIVRIARQHGVRVIYYETLVSPRVAATIAREVGARTLVLNPIEGLTAAEMRQGKHYIAVMEDNLRNLAQGLECP